MGTVANRDSSRYLGLYSLVPLEDSPTLETEEWLSLPEAVRTRWVLRVAAGMDRNSRMVQARARLGEDATEEEAPQLADTSTVGKGRVSKVDIRRAFDEGYACLHVWGLKCVGYDNEFAKMIQTKQRREAVHRGGSRVRCRETRERYSGESYVLYLGSL
ncbi:hypothetical protein OF83DRAFT_166349 [Amylostereum chailletii]|nr:hypothetical protein OF83DRAFT_166349 [Amylostereum chailletii]